MGRVIGYPGWVGLIHKKIGSGDESTRFTSDKKKLDLGQVRSGQKILTCFAMSIPNNFFPSKKKESINLTKIQKLILATFH